MTKLLQPPYPIGNDKDFYLTDLEVTLDDLIRYEQWTKVRNAKVLQAVRTRLKGRR